MIFNTNYLLILNMKNNSIYLKTIYVSGMPIYLTKFNNNTYDPYWSMKPVFFNSKYVEPMICRTNDKWYINIGNDSYNIINTRSNNLLGKWNNDIYVSTKPSLYTYWKSNGLLIILFLLLILFNTSFNEYNIILLEILL
jgi:hypothetical protein